MEETFESIEDLYKKLHPALQTKLHELHRIKMFSVKEEDIFWVLVHFKWTKEANLTLADLVDDILNTKPEILYDYIKEREAKK